MSANSVDPNLKNDTTDEFILGLDREVGRGFAVGASYIYRKYGNFQWSDRVKASRPPTGSQTSFTPATGLPGRRRSADRGAGSCAPSPTTSRRSSSRRSSC